MQGSITASCGHKLANEDKGTMVYFKDETCDWQGIRPALASALYCFACVQELNEEGIRFETYDEGLKWLDSVCLTKKEKK